MTLESTVQNQLRALYERQLGSLVKGIALLPESRRLSFPLLINLEAGSYLTSAVRLAIVGQETFGWVGDGRELGRPGALDRALDSYREFAFGRQYNASPFWVACHQLYRGLNHLGEPNGFAWTNILKLDEADRRPAPDLEDLLLQHFNVVPEELDILKPDVVVFLTGPDYDGILERTFAGVKYLPLGTDPIRVIAQLSHPRLPEATFRTYHPGYLRRARKWTILTSILESARTRLKAVSRT